MILNGKAKWKAIMDYNGTQAGPPKSQRRWALSNSRWCFNMNPVEVMFGGRQWGAVNYSLPSPQSEEEKKGKGTCEELLDEARSVCCMCKASVWLIRAQHWNAKMWLLLCLLQLATDYFFKKHKTSNLIIFQTFKHFMNKTFLSWEYLDYLMK